MRRVVGKQARIEFLEGAAGVGIAELGAEVVEVVVGVEVAGAAACRFCRASFDGGADFRGLGVLGSIFGDDDVDGVLLETLEASGNFSVGLKLAVDEQGLEALAFAPRRRRRCGSLCAP